MATRRAGFSLQGSKELAATLRKLAGKHPELVKPALRGEAEEIMTVSKRDHVPVNFGILRSTGKVGDVELEGQDYVVSMSYGGPAAPYAIAIHEHPSPHSPPSWEGVRVTFQPKGRGPKYLEKPLRSAKHGMARRLAREINVEKLR